MSEDAKEHSTELAGLGGAGIQNEGERVNFGKRDLLAQKKNKKGERYGDTCFLTPCFPPTGGKKVSADIVPAPYYVGLEVQSGSLFYLKFLKTHTHPQYFLICRLWMLPVL